MPRHRQPRRTGSCLPPMRTIPFLSLFELWCSAINRISKFNPEIKTPKVRLKLPDLNPRNGRTTGLNLDPMTWISHWHRPLRHLRRQLLLRRQVRGSPALFWAGTTGPRVLRCPATPFQSVPMTLPVRLYGRISSEDRCSSTGPSLFRYVSRSAFGCIGVVIWVDFKDFDLCFWIW